MELNVIFLSDFDFSIVGKGTKWDVALAAESVIEIIHYVWCGYYILLGLWNCYGSYYL